MSMLSSEKTIIYTQSQFLNRFDMNKETATIRLLSYLRSCGKNLSQERLIVLNTIFKQPARRHFKAEELVKILANGPKSVSRATVYRTLALFEDAELVRSIPESSRTKPQKSYEILDRGYDHGHLVCRVCGRITEYCSHEIIERQEAICRQNDFRLEKRIEQIYGICRQCQ